MTKLISGRVLRLDSANVSADRYQYLRLEEAEPDLGLPSSLGQVFTSNLSGGRAWVTLDTGNVNETSNLYYTNDRVQAFLQNTVFKTDVTLFSNLEVYGDLIVQGNTVQLNTATLIVEDKNIVLANGATNSAAADGAGITIDGAQANLIYAASSDRFVFNKVIEGNVAGTVTQLINHTTSNLTEGVNLYYTNTRVVSAITPILVTSNVLEGNNLYYTNTRVVSAVTPILTTANVSELDNQYFTNTRAILALDNANVYVGNIFAGDIISGNTLVIRGINVADDSLLGNVQATGITGNTLRIEDVFAVDIRTDSITSNTWNRLYSSNVIEFNNLFYTNSRVVSAVTPLLVTSNVVEGDNLYYTNSRVVSAVTPLLTTANVNELDNLYYTNSRVVSAVTPLLVTSNVIEGDNLYYTNSRVLAHLAVSDVSLQDLIVQGNLLVQGNTITLNTETVIVEDKNILLANGAVNSAAANGAGITVDGADATITYNSSNDSWQFNKDIRSHLIGNVTGLVSTLSNFTTSNLAEGVNLYYTNARVKTYVESLPIDLSGNTTTDLTEGNNLYYTNARVDAYINDSITTTDIDEGNNLYYTNARVDAYINDSITTTDIDEGDNLYYTNTRVVSAVDPLLTTANVDELTNQYFTNTRAVLAVNPRLTTANVTELDNLYYTNSRVVSAVTPLLVTSNVIEGDNLYYTNARVKSYVQTLPIDLSGNTTTDLAEGDNLYYTNSRVDAYINDSITTTDIDEGTRQYFTNTRALLAVNPRLTTANVTELNNLYYTNSRVTAHIAASDIETLNLTVDGNLIVVGNLSYLQVQNLEISDNMVYLNANSNVSNPDLGWAGNYNDGTYAHTGVFRDASDGIFKFFEGYTPEPDESAYINVAHESFRFANVQAENFIGKISTLSNHTTSNLLEGINLYYTNTRVASYLRENFTTDDITEGGNLYYTNTRVLSAVNPLLVTSNVLEGDNLYYTNARVDSRIAELSINVLADVDTTGIIDGQTIVWDGDTNTFIVTTLSQALAADFSTLANVANVVTTLNNFTTSNLAEGVNLYYTNARVDAYINDSITTTDIDEGSRQYFTNTRTLLAVNPLLTTANVAELNNLYYTNARVDSRISETSINALSDVNISGIEVNGLLRWDGNIFVAGSSSETTNFANTANIANVVTTLNNFTTDNLSEGSENLYFTEQRAINSLTAGRNIIILENGVVSSTAFSDLYSLDIDGAVNYNVTDSLEPGIRFPGGTDNNRFGLRSLTVTNISDDVAYISSNVLYYSTGNSAILANKIPVPVGGYLEFINKTQILQPNDIINLQAFDASLTPANNILSSIFTYETLVDDISFVGTGVTANQADSNVEVYNSFQSYTILESIKLVNTADHVVKTKVFWADANNLLKSYFVYNLPLPPNSSVEILQKPKRIEFTDKIIASYSPNSSISVFTSGRLGEIYQVESYTSEYYLTSLSNIVLSVATTASEGQRVYYTVE